MPENIYMPIDELPPSEYPRLGITALDIKNSQYSTNDELMLNKENGQLYYKRGDGNILSYNYGNDSLIKDITTVLNTKYANLLRINHDYYLTKSTITESTSNLFQNPDTTIGVNKRLSIGCTVEPEEVTVYELGEGETAHVKKTSFFNDAYCLAPILTPPINIESLYNPTNYFGFIIKNNINDKHMQSLNTACSYLGLDTSDIFLFDIAVELYGNITAINPIKSFKYTFSCGFDYAYKEYLFNKLTPLDLVIYTNIKNNAGTIELKINSITLNPVLINYWNSIEPSELDVKFMKILTIDSIDIYSVHRENQIQAIISNQKMFYTINTAIKIENIVKKYSDMSKYIINSMVSASMMGLYTNQDDLTTCIRSDNTLSRYGVNSSGQVVNESNNIFDIVDIDGDYKSPFDNMYPWSERKLCNLILNKDNVSNDYGKIIEVIYEDDPRFRRNGKDILVMVETPIFYYRIDNGLGDMRDANDIYDKIAISKTKKDGFEAPAAFIKSNNTYRDKIYTSAYDIGTSLDLNDYNNGVYTSSSGNSIYSTDIADSSLFISDNSSHSIGGHLKFLKYEHRFVSLLLYMIEFNSPTLKKLKAHASLSDDINKTGITDIITEPSGYVDASNYRYFKYRHEENFPIGPVSQIYVDLVNRNGKLYKNTSDDYSLPLDSVLDLTSIGYVDTGIEYLKNGRCIVDGVEIKDNLIVPNYSLIGLSNPYAVCSSANDSIAKEITIPYQIPTTGEWVLVIKFTLGSVPLIAGSTLSINGTLLTNLSGSSYYTGNIEINKPYIFVCSLDGGTFGVVSIYDKYKNNLYNTVAPSNDKNCRVASISSRINDFNNIDGIDNGLYSYKMDIFRGGTNNQRFGGKVFYDDLE
jgi:hypothetical protein